MCDAVEGHVGHLARRQGRLPDFLIIGAAKCGTTTLYQRLRLHPEIFMPQKKEPGFFAAKFGRGWDWYRSFFEGAGNAAACGEASTVYTWWAEYPVAAARIGRYLPHARLIYIMRHPVARTYADYCEQIKTAAKQGRSRADLRSFEAFVSANDHLVRSGEYIRYIEEYRRYFCSSQMLLLLLEDLRRDPAGVLSMVCRHLGVADDAAAMVEGPSEANTREQYHTWRVRWRLTKWLRALPGMERLGGMMPRDVRERLYRGLEGTGWGKRLRREVQPPPMDARMRRMLLDRFRTPNRRLAEYLGRNLGHWNE